MEIQFRLDDEVCDLIKATLPEGVTIDVASKVCLMGWGISNLNNKSIFEAIGRMQFRKTLRDTIAYLKNQNTKLRIKNIEDFIKKQELKNAKK